MDPELRAGIAIYNASFYHAAHDAWEELWLDLESDTYDERLLHGLIQFTAAIHHARERNWSGAIGLAESARSYLSDLPRDYRGVNVAEVRDYLAALHADPDLVDRQRSLRVTYEGEVLSLADLGTDPDAAFVAAPVIAAARGDDVDAIEQGVDYARDDLAAGEQQSQFVRLTLDYVSDEEHRGIITQRLAQHAARRTQREEDVAGLFD